MILIIEKENVQSQGGIYTVYTPSGIDISRFKKISVDHVYIEFSSPVGKCIIDVSTLLIDKSAGNPKQIIASSFMEKSSKFFWFTSASSETYKIQCQSLEESLFHIHVSDETQKEKKIKTIRLALKFDE